MSHDLLTSKILLRSSEPAEFCVSNISAQVLLFFFFVTAEIPLRSRSQMV